MATDPAIRDHQVWLGYLQPDGLVVSPAALVDAQVLLDRNAAPIQQRFLTFVREVPRDDQTVPAVSDLPSLLCGFLEWPQDCLYGLAGERPIPESLKIPLREFGETLEPTCALATPGVDGGGNQWLLLVQHIDGLADLDKPLQSRLSGWQASPSQRFERLLRETGVPIGALSNATHLRLIYAPRGENAGTLTFPVAAMAEVAGRPIVAVFHMLLSVYRLLAAPTDARLPALLKRSRDYQVRVSTALAQQVLDALYELLRGFQAADERANGELLRRVLAEDPDKVYGGLLTVLMRLVFLLYAEDRGLMPGSDLYVRNYAVHGLFERLRADAEQYPDTMEQRYGAWAQLVALFRVIHRGCEHPLLKMPSRQGHLFDPDRYPFLDGRDGWPAPAGESQPRRLPLVPDGTIYRVLAKLLLLDGQRLSYRTLDVEQIGSVYETMMGFRLEMTEGQTVALKPGKARGAPVPVSLERLLAVDGKERIKVILESTDYKLTATATGSVQGAQSVDDLLAALEKRIARNATPNPVPKGTMVLVPTDERRRSGSHYTPRTLTEPIVRKTLEPILRRLGEQPTPEQLLDLKICDPAMGSGAFLVEACRQLADELVKAWHMHNCVPRLPPDEDEFLHARRIITQRCLYGVDKNPMAVDLAKLSLWLATLAKDHPFTFLDHALRCGDSLVGLTPDQIASFHWLPEPRRHLERGFLEERIKRATDERRGILEAGDGLLPDTKRQKLAVAEEALGPVRFVGDLVVSSFFAGKRDRDRRERRDHLLRQWTDLHRDKRTERFAELSKAVEQLRGSDKPVEPFHWEVEFPEVFGREDGGFDAIVGNPPFAGKNMLINSNREYYLDWLQTLHEESHGNADLVAHFFRRAFTMLRSGGCFGLIATNTIGQGDTRSTGLRWICTHGGTIYAARRRYKWPGQAAVIVSVVHVHKGVIARPFDLDGRPVPIITAYLFYAGGHGEPDILRANDGMCFVGSYVLGLGFTFDDAKVDEGANPVAGMQRLLALNPQIDSRIFPYINGGEINDLPDGKPKRWIINFEEMTETDARSWPELIDIVERKVKPARAHLTRNAIGRKRAKYWWTYASPASELYAAIRGLDRVLVRSLTSTNFPTFTFLPNGYVYDQTLIVLRFTACASLAVLCSRVHEVWCVFFGATFKDDPRYNVDLCFKPFPFLPTPHPHVEGAGKAYYEFRAALMVRNNEGLTKTYNRFHDPGETSPDIARLRELHAAMDWAVLDAYGWTDIPTDCGFALDYLDIEDEDDLPPQARERIESGDLFFPDVAAALAFNAAVATGRRRLPWRYRWPDDIRDEVLARLLKLNADRAEEERRSGLSAQAGKKKPKSARPKKPSRTAMDRAQMSLGEDAHG